MRNKARMKKFLPLLFFLFPPLGGMMGGLHAQINTDHVMMMGRNALYYEDYVLSIQRFNMVINAKPFLAEPYFFRGLANSSPTSGRRSRERRCWPWDMASSIKPSRLSISENQ